ncbi:MAG: 2-phospho-L-lactate transferase CofD family protein [Candidatus Binatia bacterium]
MSSARLGKRSGVVFFSGGSALTGLARVFAESGVHATHVIAVFDDGGSAGRLRDACGGIAIGDIRKRLIAIGDRATTATRSVIELLQARLPARGPMRAARAIVEGLASGTDTSLRSVPPRMATDISRAMAHILEALPASFEWRDASVGNLILAGRYRQCGDWGTVLQWAQCAVSACGTVLPVSTTGAHLGARLANGRYVRGQSAITDETTPIESPIDRLELYQPARSGPATDGVSAHAPTLQEIANGRSIVYAWGSFYTSLLCSLLVPGIATALAASSAPKILLLNPFVDAETVGGQPHELVQELCRYGAGANGNRAGRLLTHVLALRLAGGARPGLYDACHRARLEALGIRVVEVEARGIPRGAELRAVMDHLLALSRTGRTDNAVGRSPRSADPACGR